MNSQKTPLFFIDRNDLVVGLHVALSEEEMSPIKARRLSDGAIIRVFNRKNDRFKARLNIESNRSFSIEIAEEEMDTNNTNPRFYLFQAMPKLKKMDDIIRMTTELGVSGIFPMITEHVVKRSDDDSYVKMKKRYDDIVIAAVRQSNLSYISKIHESLLTFKESLDFIDAHFENEQPLRILFFENETEHTLKQIMDEPTNSRDVVFLIGPEGGFSKREVDEALSRGFRIVNLKCDTLRTETAAAVVLSAMRYHLGML